MTDTNRTDAATILGIVLSTSVMSDKHPEVCVAAARPMLDHIEALGWTLRPAAPAELVRESGKVSRTAAPADATSTANDARVSPPTPAEGLDVDAFHRRAEAICDDMDAIGLPKWAERWRSAWRESFPSSADGLPQCAVCREPYEIGTPCAEGLDVARLVPLLAVEFGKAGFFKPSASLDFLTQQAEMMLWTIAREYAKEPTDD